MFNHSEPMLSLAAMQNRLVVKGQLTALTALRIGAGRSTALTGSDLPILRDSAGRPFIPGASLKGVLRSQAEALIRTINAEQVRDARELEQHLENVIRDIITQDYRTDLQRSQDIWQKSSPIEQVFGSPWNASHLYVKDALISEDVLQGQQEIRNSVAINRDTETAEDQRLYDYEVTPAGSRFQFELVMENAEDWQLGLLMLLLKPWQRGEVAIGGFRSRGLGWVKLEAGAHIVQVTDVESIIDLVLRGADRTDNVVSEDDEILWINALKTYLRNLSITAQAAS